MLYNTNHIREVTDQNKVVYIFVLFFSNTISFIIQYQWFVNTVYVKHLVHMELEWLFLVGHIYQYSFEYDIVTESFT